MNISLSASLKLLALYLWSYIPIFVLSLSSVRDTAMGKIFIRDAQVAHWEFELLFMMIFLIWGIYVWKIADNTKENTLFLNFTIWVMTMHVLWMFIVGFLNSNDTMHMLRDVIIPLILLCLIVYLKKHATSTQV